MNDKNIIEFEDYINLCNDYDKNMDYDNIIHGKYGVTTINSEVLFISKHENSLVLLPNNEFSPILYRGQNDYYKDCKPSLFRNKNKFFREISEIKKIEFFNILEELPFIKYLKKATLYNYNFKIDFEAIAQHYNFETTHLDLTRSKDIAMFFATTQYKDGEYHLIHKDKEVVLYYLNLKKYYNYKKKILNPIGFQPVKRPDNQKAFSIILEEEEDFNSLPFVEKEIFTITKDDSKFYYEKFEGGKLLFPDEPLNNLAKNIQKKTSLNKNSVLKYCQKNKIDYNNFVKELLMKNYSLRENTYYLSRREIYLLKKNLYNEIFDLKSRIKVRFCDEHFEI